MSSVGEASSAVPVASAATMTQPPTAPSTPSVVVDASVNPTDFEAEHVHRVYDVIAGHFSSTRYKAWPLVRRFVEELPRGSLMADVGCGNGKNLLLSDGVACIGCDYSAALLKIAAGQHLDVFRADGLCTSFRSDVFDAAISIAVIHHFANRVRRLAAIVELLRIVKPCGGRVLIYVWAKEQPKRRADAGGNGDVLIPWEMHKKFDASETVHTRYYHLFAQGELEELCNDACIKDGMHAVVETSYYDKENWCVVLRRQEEVDELCQAGDIAPTDGSLSNSASFGAVQPGTTTV